MFSRVRLLFLSSLGLLTGACSLTLPVSGRANDGSEVFTGSATGYPNGSGDFSMSSERGVRCGGAFVYITRREGEGVLNCTDGRSG